MWSVFVWKWEATTQVPPLRFLREVYATDEETIGRLVALATDPLVHSVHVRRVYDGQE